MKPGLTREYQAFAAQNIDRHLRHVLGLLKDVRRDKDMEPTHRIRVACRRLRSVLKLFADCFPEKNVKRWRKHIQLLMRVLGEARDKDVQIEYITNVLKHTGNRRYSFGIKRLLSKLQRQRKKFQKQVTRALARFDASKVGVEMKKQTRKKLSRFMLATPKEWLATPKEWLAMPKERLAPGQASVQNTHLYRQAADSINSRLEKLLAYKTHVYHPNHVQELHAMRIAAKRLRYCLETFEPLFPDGLDDSIGALRHLQDTLGDIHDCDVWLQYLPLFLESELACGKIPRDKRSVLRVGIRHLVALQKARRSQQFADLVKSWREYQRNKIWTSLLVL